MKHIAKVYALLLTGLLVMGICSFTSIVVGVDAQSGFLFDSMGRPIIQNNTTPQVPASASGGFLFDETGKPIEQRENRIMCNQPYGLCTIAKCVPLKSDPTKAICSCMIEDGVSTGQTNCSARQPVDLVNDATLGWMIAGGAPFAQLTSTYSFMHSLPTAGGAIPNRTIDPNYTGDHVLKSCPGIPWANCLDMPCIVPPADPTANISEDREAADYAICNCEMVTNLLDFYMVGQGLEDCSDSDLCNKYTWSAADPKQLQAGLAALRTYLATYPDEDPAQQYEMPFCENCTNST
jgi:hypothetical protein